MSASTKSPSTSLSQDEVRARLQRHDILPTPQRVQIAQILLARHQHLSADQVLTLVNRDKNQASKATVYNTLRLFANKGLVREVIVDPTKVFFDTNTRSHHHFYNVDTGNLTDIEAHRLPVGELPQLPKGTTIDGVEVIIRVRNEPTR